MAQELEHVKGLPELARLFAQAGRDVGPKVLRPGAAAGGALLRDAIKAAAPIRKSTRRYGRYAVPPGTLRAAALEKFAREMSNDTQAEYVVTFRRGKRYQKSGRDAYYAPWVERGHLIVSRTGKTPAYLKSQSITARRKQARAAGRRVPGLFFMARATAANVEQAAEKMVHVMDAKVRTIQGIS